MSSLNHTETISTQIDTMKPKMALSLARQFNQKLTNLNEKWIDFSGMIQRNFHDEMYYSSIGNNSNKKKTRRRKRNSIDIDMLVMKTVDWDDNESY